MMPRKGKRSNWLRPRRSMRLLSPKRRRKRPRRKSKMTKLEKKRKRKIERMPLESTTNRC